MNITKVDRARILRRCRKPALASMEYSQITEELYEICSACADIHYFADDERSLLDALEGDDEAAYEFQMAFSALDEKAQALSEELEREEWALPYDDFYDPEADFNSCLVALVGDFYRHRGDILWGYDTGEGDYFELGGYDAGYATDQAVKRLCRKTKEQMVRSIQMTLRVFLAMIDIRQEYDYLKAAFDLVKDENMSLLRTITEIEKAYDLAEKASDGFKWQRIPEVKALDRLISTLPDRCWVE